MIRNGPDILIHISPKVKVQKHWVTAYVPNSLTCAWTAGAGDVKGTSRHSRSFQNHSLYRPCSDCHRTRLTPNHLPAWLNPSCRRVYVTLFRTGINSSCYKNRWFQQTTPLLPQSDSVGTESPGSRGKARHSAPKASSFQLTHGQAG